MKTDGVLKSDIDNGRGQSGQALLMVTISLAMMLGMMGLVVDLGWAYFRRDAAQTAADAAAAAVVRAALATSPGTMACGTSGVWCGTTPGTPVSCPATAPTSAATSFDNGCMLAAANGFTGLLPQTVTIQANTTTSAPTAPGMAVTYWATVRVGENTLPFFGTSSTATGRLTSVARATAGVTQLPNSGISSSCMYILSTTGVSAFSAGNGIHFTTSSCGIYVNSNANPAMSVIGGATITSPSIKVVGTYSQSNGGNTSTTPVTGVTPIPDPFLSLPALTPAGSCITGSYTTWQATPYALLPGTYCGFTVSNGASATMAAGTYIVNGGTFNIQGGSTLTGSSGVMVYLTNGATVNIANGAVITMSPQSSGTYQGILFFQDRSMASPGTSYFAGGSNMHLSGSLYFPHALLNVDNGNNTQTMAIVADSVNLQGGATLTQAITASQTGLGVGGSVVSVIE